MNFCTLSEGAAKSNTTATRSSATTLSEMWATSTALLVLLSVALLLWLFYWQRKQWRLIWQLNGWRGVAQQPLLWLLAIAYLEPKSILNTATRLRRLFQRPLAITFGYTLFLYVDDPGTMERIFNAPECLDKCFMQEGFFARKGLLHAKGQKWKIRRKQLNPAFSRSIILSCLSTFNTVATQLQQKFAEELLGDDVKFSDVEDLLSRAVLEVSCQTTMGTETHFTQSDPDSIARAYKKLMEISALKIVKPWLQSERLMRLLDSQSHESGLRCNKLVAQFVSDIVQRKHGEWQQQRRQVNNSNGSAAAAGDDADAAASGGVDANVGTIASEPQRRIFIEQIFHLAETGELTLQDIMDESQSMVLVSFETVSDSLIVALLCLATNLDCQQKLRQEIKATLGSNIDAGHIEFSRLQQMKYLDMVVHESLRLLTTVPMNLRHVSSDFQLRLPRRRQRDHCDTSGDVSVCVPKGTIIVLDVFNMQRDAAHWGPRAMEFYPEHFAEQNTSERHPYAFVPFSKGLRTCIGWRYSIFLIKILLVKVIASFQFSSDTKLEQLRFIEGISLKFENPDSITFQIRKVDENDNKSAYRMD